MSTCSTGAFVTSQVAFVAARSIVVPRGADEGESAEQFAAALMDKWGVGDASCNDGVLLLLTLQPRQVSLLHANLRPYHVATSQLWVQ